MYSKNVSPTERTGLLQSKMALALADAWMDGHRDTVRSTIGCGMSAEIRQDWKDATANALPADERQRFLDFMRA